MRQRCLNPKAENWARYGGAGITICEHWDTFANFLADMGPRPSHTSLERRKNSLGYTPDNCLWATAKEQANNRRSTTKLTNGDITQSASQWADQLGVERSVVHSRLKRGWSIEQATTLPKLEHAEMLTAQRLTLNGTTDTLLGWAQRLNLSYAALRKRLVSGWPLEKALTQARRGQKPIP